jgi:glycerophosphoryl diester phosphodiesterase
VNADYLTALLSRPIAHRGLHNAATGVIENTLGAARAAIAANFAIECDVQLTKDGAAVVFHDDDLDRLTQASGLVRDWTSAALQRQPLRHTTETIPSLSDFLDAIAGRVPLVIELKSAFDGDLRLPRTVADALRAYRGAVYLESFDPAMMTHLRVHAAAMDISHIPLGIVGEADYTENDWQQLSPHQRREMTHFLHFPHTRPDFISWNVADLPHAIPFLAREGLRLPVTAWTIRNPDQVQQARQWADQIVFESYTPA